MKSSDEPDQWGNCMACGALSPLLRCRACFSIQGWGNFVLGLLAGALVTFALAWLLR